MRGRGSDALTIESCSMQTNKRGCESPVLIEPLSSPSDLKSADCGSWLNSRARKSHASFLELRSPDVGGHQILPTGGHVELPADGHSTAVSDR